MVINRNERFYLLSDVTYKPIGEGGIILNLASGIFYTVNDSGAFIISNLKGATIDELTRSLCRDFDVDPQRAEQCVEKFLSCLRDEKLIETDA